MELHTFSHGSPVHILSLVVCIAASFSVATGASRLRHHPVALTRFRCLIVLGCLLSWLVTFLFGLRPATFRWDEALPLHFCNLANLIGALAVARRPRLAQSLLYFWTFALCIWAFLTPALFDGPAQAGFWVFWIYHLFIPVSLAWVLAVDGFRPRWRDLRNATGLTFLYMCALAALNAVTGWNYGFVGPGKPGQPSLVDVLGPYPLRLAWMALLGAALFLLLLLPWLRKPASSGPNP